VLLELQVNSRKLTRADECAEGNAEAETDGNELQSVWYVQSCEARVAQAVQKWKTTKHEYK
jgi:hypothetical protein